MGVVLFMRADFKVGFATGILLSVWSPALAAEFVGRPHVIDGDTIEIEGRRLRLDGIDAPEGGQSCERQGQRYDCGSEATRALTRIINGQPVRCEGSKRDRYGRAIVTCFAGRTDVGRELVTQGWAVAEFGETYVREESAARSARRGLWAGQFQRPIDWRRR
jgi:endonuclease YncB( thermonuclease family)